MSLFKRRFQYIPILSNFHIFKKYVQQLRQTENWCLCTLSAIIFDILMCAVRAPGNRSSSNLCFSYLLWLRNRVLLQYRERCNKMFPFVKDPTEAGRNEWIGHGWVAKQSKSEQQTRLQFDPNTATDSSLSVLIGAIFPNFDML